VIFCWSFSIIIRTQLELIEQFGKFGANLYRYCRGQDDRPVQSSRIRKSVSVETTFVEDITMMAQCLAEIPALFSELLRRLERHSDHIIHKQFIKMKFTDFSQSTKECVVTDLQQQTFIELVTQSWQEHGQAIRLLGIGVRFTTDDQLTTQPDLLATIK
jgi:DNA polymerase-4